jgi:predicted ATPase/DNA-binding winged helix-turn-helix (wHTH) protein
MPSVSGMKLRFGTHEVLPVERQLRVAGEPVALGARAFDVLMALIERAGRTVSRGELLDAAWPGLVVEENNLSVQIATLRRVLGPQAITTIPGLGYRFSAVLEASAEAASEAAAPAPAHLARVRAGNVAPFQPSLIGRDDEVTEMESLLLRHRLVSISGAGGIGKTRLAWTVAARLRERFSAGVWAVELAPIKPTKPDDGAKIAVDARNIGAAIIQTLGVSLPGLRDPLVEMAEALAEDDLLLVLDNCEHVVDGASHVARLLAAHTRRLRVLTTTQAPLRLSEERVFPLSQLSVPRDVDDAIDEHGAIRLLVERVRALQPRFALGPDNAADAVEVCRQLDGLPLAIELAAARVPLLGMAGVRRRMGERLQLLTRGARGANARHATLRTMLAWSHSLLSPAEAAAFRRTAVFAGSFTLEQAQEVLAGAGGDLYEALDTFGSLVDKSLIVVERSEPPRYRLLESARAYALEMLRDAGERDDLGCRHAQAYARLFARSLAEEWTLASQKRRARYQPDLDNARAALDWAEHADAALYAALAGSTAWLFAAVGHAREGLVHCERALRRSAPDAGPEARARLLREICQYDHGLSSPRKLAAAKQAVRLLRPLGDFSALYSALGRLAIAAALCDCVERGDAATSEMARLRDVAWPPLARWDLLNARDYVANAARRADEAEALAEEQLELARAHDDVAKMLFAMLAKEQCVSARGCYEEAVDRGRALIELAQRENYLAHLHIYLFNLATALAMCGRIDDALPLARRSAELEGRRDALWKGLELMALIAWLRDRVDAAARILGRSDAVYNGRRREPVEDKVYERVAGALRQRLSPEDCIARRAEGAGLSDAQATALALDDVATSAWRGN